MLKNNDNVHIIRINAWFPNLLIAGICIEYELPIMVILGFSSDPFSAVNPVLNRVPQILYLADQPCRRHRDSEWADEKRHHQQDDPVCNLMGNQRQHTEDAEDRSSKTEHPRRAVQQSGADPDENGQDHDDRSDEYFQYQPHKIGPLYNF